MRKLLLSALSIIALGSAVAFAANLTTIGTPPIPGNGPGLVDGTWLNAVAGGANQSYQNGLTATGTNQATAFVMKSPVAFTEFDSVPSGTGAMMPQAIAGICVIVFNHDAANTLTVYVNSRINPAVGTADVFEVGSASSVTIAHGVNGRHCSAKTGIWD